ncbi:hypothetical protein ACIQU1_33215 [Streptomyces angustmyceticus]|uniref:hypothetical protein n=1 Tax=Streptomyces angustmyceticus TaxID=285578 RepID=UPI00344C81E1
MGVIGLRRVDALWAGARSVEVELRWPGEEERSSVMVGGVAEIAELAGLLETDGTAAPFTCMCLGEVTFTVRGERGVVLGVLTHHLDGGLDWDQWGGELPLLHPRGLSRWLARRGVVTGGGVAWGDPP